LRCDEYSTPKKPLEEFNHELLPTCSMFLVSPRRREQTVTQSPETDQTSQAIFRKLGELSMAQPSLFKTKQPDSNNQAD